MAWQAQSIERHCVVVQEHLEALLALAENAGEAGTQLKYTQRSPALLQHARDMKRAYAAERSVQACSRSESDNQCGVSVAR